MGSYHAFLSPSGTPAWELCELKPWLEKGLPRTSNPASSEGTAAHTLGADCLEHGYPAVRDIGRQIEADGIIFTVDDGMAQFVQVYVDYVEALIGEHDWYGIEQHVPVAHITGEWIPADEIAGTLELEATGQSDAVVVVGDTLHVVDLKFGRGVIVYAEDNSQLRMYASGALRILPAQLRNNITKIVTHIVQPRLGHIDTETITRNELGEWAAKTATIADRIMAGPDGLVAVPGEKQCKFCGVAGSCRARAEQNLALVENEFEVIIDDPVEVEQKVIAAKARLPYLEAEELAALMPNLDMITDWCNSVRAEVTSRILSGRAVVGYKPVAGKKGNRAWSDAVAAEKKRKRFSAVIPKTAFYTEKIISPTQAEALLKKPHPEIWEQFKSLIVQPDGPVSVVPDSDKRPALTLGITADDFSVIEEKGIEE